MKGLGIKGVYNKIEDNDHDGHQEEQECPMSRDDGDINATPSLYAEELEYENYSPPPQKNPLPHRSKSSQYKYLAQSILSIVLSLFYLSVAAIQPTWPHMRDNYLSKNLTSLGAKVIEITFGSICVLYLGQVLTRRSTNKRKLSGVSLNQICMRDWIIDPGSMFSDGKVFGLGTKSLLGWYVLAASISAALYGTAANTLILPTLRQTSSDNIIFHGTVKPTFASQLYLESDGEYPYDDQATASTNRSFTSVDYAARGGVSYSNYLRLWYLNSDPYEKTGEEERPIPWIIDRDTQCRINSSWAQNLVTPVDGRTINNITLAIPHPGVYQAATNRTNLDLQPGDSESSVGDFSLTASVPSPYLNILCVNIAEKDIQDLVFQKGINGTLGTDTQLDATTTTYWLNSFDWENYASVLTPLDSVFGWGTDRKRPVFYRYPPPNQMILNGTLDIDPYNSHGMDALYVLGASMIADQDSAPSYFLCSSKAGLLASCSTELSKIGASSSMVAFCEDDNNPMSYLKSNPSAQDEVDPNWVAVASLAATSLGLNAGEQNSVGDIPTSLTDLFLKNASLPLDKPSPAEALAACLMPMLVLAAHNSPFEINSDSSGNYSGNDLLQTFRLNLQQTMYASGGEHDFKQTYMVIISAICLMNIYMFWYLFIKHRRSLIIDICDPMNLFGLAASSEFSQFPSSHEILSPKKEIRERPLSTEWKIVSENGRLIISEAGSIFRFVGSVNDCSSSTGLTPLINSRGLREQRVPNPAS